MLWKLTYAGSNEGDFRAALGTEERGVHGYEIPLEFPQGSISVPIRADIG